MDDLVLQVRQIASYPEITAASPGDAFLLQQGGLGGPYGWTTPAGLLAALAASPVTFQTLNLAGGVVWNLGHSALWADGGGLSFALDGQVGFHVANDGSVSLGGSLVAQGPISVQTEPNGPNELATLQWVTDHTVWTFNGRQGNVQLCLWDVVEVGGAPIESPGFSGYPTVPTVQDPTDASCLIANTAFVNAAIIRARSAMPMVATFNGRTGCVVLTTQDILCAGGAPIISPAFQGTPTAPTPLMSDYSDRIATTRFVGQQIDDVNNRLFHLTNLVMQNIDESALATKTWVEQTFAPIADAVLTGQPSAPTAPLGNNSGRIATTAFVQQAVEAATAGVASFNGRTGIVTLQAQDLTDVNGALLASPTFTGIPQAPTAPNGTSSGQLATTAFVMQEISAIDSGVTSFNGRSGTVSLTLGDVTDVGGAPNASPALTGTPTAPTPAPGNSSQLLATTAFVTAAIAALPASVQSFNGRTGAVNLNSNDLSAVGGALLAGPAFTGVPTAPTAAVGTATTQLATTAFVANSSTNIPAVRYDQAQGLTAGQQLQARQNIAVPAAVLVARVTRFNGSGTYTPDPNMVFCRVQCLGGGGGGGGAVTSTLNTATYAGGGGASGNYSERWLTRAQVLAQGATAAVVIGAGGAAGQGNTVSATTGGNTTFGTGPLCNAVGGGPGIYGGPGQVPTPGVWQSTAGSVGDILLNGEAGDFGASNGASASIYMPSGKGGSSILGPGGQQAITSGTSANGLSGGLGGGGSGGTCANVANGSANGGPGGNGVCIVTEFCTQ
jgi:hypothetical protein